MNGVSGAVTSTTDTAVLKGHGAGRTLSHISWVCLFVGSLLGIVRSTRQTGGKTARASFLYPLGLPHASSSSARNRRAVKV